MTISIKGQPALTREQAVAALKEHKTKSGAARALGVSRNAISWALQAKPRNEDDPEYFKKELGEKSRIYVITCAQNAVPPHKKFLQSLLRYCEHRKARLLVVPVRYKNPTSQWTQNMEDCNWWHKDLQPYLFSGRAELNDNLLLLGDIKVQPTATNPLSSFQSISGHMSGIIGHPKLALSTVPTPGHAFPKILTTTGSVTRKDYTDTRAGKAGEFHHTFGACVVEIQDDRVFHIRQINAVKDGSFIDLDTHYSHKRAKPAPRAAGLVMGDSHVLFIDPQVVKATFGTAGADGVYAAGIIDVLRPKELVWHDVLDAFSISHHHKYRPFLKLAKRKAGLDNLGSELKTTLHFIDTNAPAFAKNVIVASNHNEHFHRWLEDTDWRADPENAEVYLETALMMAQRAKMVGAKSIVPDPLKYWSDKLLSPSVRRRTTFLDRDSSYDIKGIEVGHHGDVGANGARGTVQSFKRTGRKTVTGHSHSPCIDEGAYRVGTSSVLQLDYNHGLSGWLQTHCIVYANGKRCLITCIGGNWRLND